jgi:hypothetical protein
MIERMVFSARRKESEKSFRCDSVDAATVRCEGSIALKGRRYKPKLGLGILTAAPCVWRGYAQMKGAGKVEHDPDFLDEIMRTHK